jgi:isoquinoline 1-oxidoreductase alpha subunit
VVSKIHPYKQGIDNHFTLQNCFSLKNRLSGKENHLMPSKNSFPGKFVFSYSLFKSFNFIAMPSYSLTINGKQKKVEVDADTPLLWVLRDHLTLLGTKFGCGIGQCGACTVHVNGNVVRSCQLPVSSVKGPVTTIEGLSENGDHPLQLAWDEVDVPQCGYCQAGQIMTAAALLKRTPKPSLEQVENAMHANICRCGAYYRIREAVLTASKK